MLSASINPTHHARGLAEAAGTVKAQTVDRSRHYRGLFETADASITESVDDSMPILGATRLIGGGIILILIIGMVLNEVYDAISVDSESPWYELVETLEGTGMAAIALLIVGLLVLAAREIMNLMGAGGFGGGR